MIFLISFIFSNLTAVMIEVPSPSSLLDLFEERDSVFDSDVDRVFSAFDSISEDVNDIDEIFLSFDRLVELRGRALSQFSVDLELRKGNDIKGGGLAAAALLSAGLAVGMHFSARYFFEEYNSSIETDLAVVNRRSTQACDSFMVLFGLSSVVLAGLSGYYLATGPDRADIRSSQLFAVGGSNCITRGY
ncbi:MAG: hypothetical protein JXR63_13395 [Spirochaetales bacterium]|nr:hypothetical protein [Spirochaetales bacterium]